MVDAAHLCVCGVVVRFFWETLESFTNEQRLRFIRFAWGQERLPLTDAEYAARNVRLLIKPWMLRGPVDRALPLADTCFFNLALPPYTSLSVTKRQLLAIVNMDCGLDGDEVTLQ